MNAPATENSSGKDDEDGKAATAAPVPKPSAGALLKLARERAGLAVEDLAVQIKLAKSTLEALERDDFAALSEPVYVRGYYRKIAKVLPVSEKELLDAYALCTPAVVAPVMQRIPQLAGGVDAGVSRRARGQGLAVTAVIVGLTLGALLLFADQNKPERLAKSEPVTELKITPQPAPVISEAPLESSPSPQGAAPQAATEPAAAEAAPAASGTSVGGHNSSSITPAAAPEQTTIAISPAAASAAPNQLVLEFSESSFVRVEDSRNRTLAIGLVRGGERQVLDGQPPYTVFLGNARNVKVFHQSKPVDFSTRINVQNDTARFTVP